jgi:hypothetical protein
MMINISCLLALSFTGMSAAVEMESSDGQVLYSYEGNLTEKNILPIDLLSFIGAPAYFFAEAVKFNAPKPDWKINAVQIYGWDGFDGSNESIPAERVIAMEIRDKDLNLLYQFADSQIPYTNYARNATVMYPITIELPQVPVSGEFYVCFYDRGAVAVASEALNESSKTSYIFVEDATELLNATLPTGKDAVIPVNWIMAVRGK